MCGVLHAGAHEQPKVAKERVTPVPCKYKIGYVIPHFMCSNSAYTAVLAFQIIYGSHYY